MLHAARTAAVSTWQVHMHYGTAAVRVMHAVNGSLINELTHRFVFWTFRLGKESPRLIRQLSEQAGFISLSPLDGRM